MFKPEIQKQFNKVIAHSQHGIEEPNTDDLFAEWQKAKQGIYKHLFDNQLIKNCGPVEINLDTAALAVRYIKFIKEASRLYPELLSFLEKNSVTSFYNNLLDTDYVVSKDKVITAGTKIIKCFKYFITDPERLRQAQDFASLEIQQTKMRGELCLSIHPLDYLSMSENNYNWRSCHALDGEFKAGNLSYMIDNTTIVAYLRSYKDTKLPRFPEDVPWNEKHWRCLDLVDNAFNPLTVLAAKQYPMELPGILDTIRDSLCPIRGAKAWTDWSDKCFTNHEGQILNEPYYSICGYLISKSRFVVDKPGSRQFNDLLWSSSAKLKHTWRRSAFLNKEPQFFVGGQVKCLRCGNDPITTEDTMMCKECELAFGNSEDDSYLDCEICGDRFYRQDGGWTEDDYRMCPHCLEYKAFTCRVCNCRYSEYSLAPEESDLCVNCR